MAERKQPEKKRGPKGGIKHRPGRGHDRKGGPQKKQRFRKKVARIKREKAEEARRQ